MPWMHIDLWFTVGDFSNVQYQTFDDRRFIFVHVARASRDDRDITVPRVREAAVVTFDVIGEAFEYISFADVRRTRLRPRVPDHIDTCSANQFDQVHVTKSLEVSVYRVHRCSLSAFPGC